MKPKRNVRPFYCVGKALLLLTKRERDQLAKLARRNGNAALAHKVAAARII